MGDQPNEQETQTGTTPDTSGGNSSGQVTFTQEQQDHINRLIGDARKTGRQTGLTDFLKELDIEKPEDAKALIAAAKKRADAEKTDVQRATEAAEREKQRAADLENELKEERQQRVFERRDDRIRAKAATAHDPDAVLEWANRAANKALLDKTLTAESAVDDKAVDALIDACRKAAPHLFKAAKGVGSPSTTGGRTPDANAETQKRASRLNQNRIRG